MKKLFEICPVCRKVKEIAVVCATCVGVLAGGSHDPHLENTNYAMKPSTTITATVESSASDTGDVGALYMVRDWPPESS